MQYYVNFAKGGVEMIWIEGISDLEPPADGSAMPEETLAFGKKLVEECGKYGASLGYQWAQFGADLYFILNGIEGATGFGTQYDFKRYWQGQLIGDTSGAGMLLDVAARIAAARGHKVTLYEKNGRLGGLLDFAHAVKGSHENLQDLKKYLIRQMELAGVEVKLETEVDQALIESEAPDAVILAAGGLRDTLTVEGDGSIPVIEMEQFMFTEMGENVIVYGSNAQAFDCALWLTVHKKHVTMVTPNAAAEMDMQQSQHAMRMMTTALYSLGFNSWPQASIKEAKAGKAVIATQMGVDIEIPCDAIINAADMLPNTGLLDGISVKETYAVGDCAAPFNIAKAIHAGNDAGRAV